MLPIAMTGLLLMPCVANENAADLYNAAFERVAARTDEEVEQLAWIAECLQHWYPVDAAAVRDWKAAQDGVIDQIVLASSHPHCDFGVNLEESGFNALLPHLGAMRGGMQALETAATVALAEGNADEAARYAEAAIRAGQHIQSDRVLIGSLVSVAVVDKLASRMVDNLLSQGQLKPNTAAELAHRFESAANGDAFGVIEALRTEQRITQGWLKRQFGLDDPTLDPASRLPTPSGEIDDGLAQHFGGLPGVTVGQAQEAFTKLFEAQSLAIAAAANPSLERGLEMLNKADREVASGKYGALAQLLLPALKGVLEKRNEAVARLRGRVGQLQSFAAGRVNPATLVNGGRLWLEAGFVAAAARQPWIKDPIAAATIDELLRRSALAKEATTPPVWEHRLEAPVPWWLPDMELLVHGLLDRLALHRSDEATTGLVDDVAVLLRMIAAMSNDPHIASSLLAADTLAQITPIVSRLAAHPHTSAADRRALEQLVRTIPNRDPAGLQRAEAETRNRLAAFLQVSDSFDASVPTDANALLPFIAWARGTMQTIHPDRRMIPRRQPPRGSIGGLDTTTLATWQELGAAGGPPNGFGDLPACDLGHATTSVPQSIAAMRSALSE